MTGYDRVRELVSPLENDRVLTPDIEILSAAIAQGKFSGALND
jgi:histidine ammonia-lyase